MIRPSPSSQRPSWPGPLMTQKLASPPSIAAVGSPRTTDAWCRVSYWRPARADPVHPSSAGRVMDASLAEEFGRLAIELHGRRSLDETIDQVVQYALTAVDCDFADVMFLHREKRIETVAATDSLAEKAAQLQAELDEGPVLALPPEPGDHIVVHDTTSDVRWPRWGAELGALGVRSVLSTRLASEHALIGALNLYAHEPLSFDGDDIAIAHILARHASVALATRSEEHTSELQSRGQLV